MEDMAFSMVNLEQDNIAGDLNLLLFNVPEDVSLLEKIRWLYIKTGQLFSYDYRIGSNLELARNEVDFLNNHISRYQTCTQISYIFKLMVEFLDPNIKVNVIERIGQIRNMDGVEHVANEIFLPNGERYIMDLTLDLYLIQSGCMTRQFGHTTDLEGNQDIISLSQCRRMDEKLGLIKNGEYTDYKIAKMKEYINSLKPFADIQQQYNCYINVISGLTERFNGAYESKQYISKLFQDFIDMPYREFNLTYTNDAGNQLVTCYLINPNTENELWLVYNSKIGLLKSSKRSIIAMLKLGWLTRSETLNKMYKEETGLKF